jgi:hypothetical protein
MSRLWVELILERAAPHGLATTAVAPRVAALDHELLDDAVEDEVVVVPSLGEGNKVFDWCVSRAAVSPNLYWGGGEEEPREEEVRERST